MRVLLIGVGGVGEAIAVFSQNCPWMEKMVLADYNLKRAKEVQARLTEQERYPAEFLDASKKEEIISLAKKYKVDLIMNATVPYLVEPIFDAAFSYGCNYIDMAVALERPNPEKPWDYETGMKMGDYQFERSQLWEEKGLLAILGMGVDPGMSDVFARYAKDFLFGEIEEVHVRDGNNIEVEGYEFAPTFNIWTTIDECLNPPVIWERDKGWYLTEPFSDPEIFDFPEIGPLECVNVDHEEVVFVPRYIPAKKVTFKYGLGKRFIEILKILHLLGLDGEKPIRVKEVEVVPRDVVAALLPDPASLGDKMKGKTCVGTWVKGFKDRKRREVFIYNVVDNEDLMRRFGLQAIVGQTGVFPVIAMDLLEHGQWQGKGVHAPEFFPPEPFMRKISDYGFSYQIKEMIP